MADVVVTGPIRDRVDGDDDRALFTEMAMSDAFTDFLTLPAGERMP